MKNKYILALLIAISFFLKINAFDKSDVNPESADATSILNVWWWDGFEILDNIFAKATEHIFAIIALILIAVFIYIGFLFITSEWDEAQFKKAWKTFVYTIIWIVVIVLSLWAVKLVTSIWI